MIMSFSCLPNDCEKIIVDKLDIYSKLCYSLINKETKSKYFCWNDVLKIQAQFKQRKSNLIECHKYIRNIFNNNVIAGWCEICNQPKLLRSNIKLDMGTEKVIWICIDSCYL